MQNNVRKNDTKDIFLEILAVCFLASAGLFVRKSALSPINTGLWRIILATPFLFVLSYKELKTLNKKKIFLAFLSGIFLAGDLTFFNLSLVMTSLANTNLLTNLTAFIIVPVSYFIFKEKIPKFYLVGLMITIVGVVILITGKKVPSTSNYVGDIFAMCACIFYSLFFLVTYRLRNEMSGSLIMFIGAFGTMLVLIFSAFFIEGLQAPKNINDFLILLGFALFMQVIGQNLLAHCQGKISVNLSSVITLMQPVIAAIYSLIFFKETLSIKEIIGIIIVIVGVYICKKQYE